MADYSDYSAPELVKMLGSRFKDYRLRANMTQKEVAEMAGLGKAARGHRLAIQWCPTCASRRH
jgi:transcriptional regulator with XRE-family HTH domain